MAESYSYPYGPLLIHFQKAGAGRPLLILHGWGVDGSVMMPLARQLADMRCSFVPDLPGFGNTPDPPEAWSIDDYTDMIIAFIQAHFDEPVDLLVHSFGGRIALKLCARPIGEKLVNKVLITGGAGMKPHRNAAFYLKKYTAKALKMPFLVLPSPMREKVLAKLRSTPVWKALGSGGYAKLDGVMREVFVKSVTEFLEPCLPKIPHEVLLLWGKNDKATPLYQARRMEEGIAHAALVELEGAGHYAFLDRPGRFVSIARAFFDQNGQD